MKELITLKQVAIIEQRLKEISAEIDIKVNQAKALVCTEDTYKDIKKIRTELKKQYTELETQRKSIKEAVIKPYLEFEGVYKSYIGNKFIEADNVLKTKIDEVENTLKTEKEEEIKRYFDEYCQSKSIDFITIEQVGLNINLSNSVKKLKEATALFIDKIADDLLLINTQNFSNEILLEYKQHLNVSKAIVDVTDRREALKQMEIKEEETATLKEKQTEAVKKVEALTAPTEEEVILTANFTVKGTLKQLKALKAYMVENNLKFE